jgi:hypothetical protein
VKELLRILVEYTHPRARGKRPMDRRIRRWRDVHGLPGEQQQLRPLRALRRRPALLARLLARAAVKRNARRRHARADAPVGRRLVRPRRRAWRTSARDRIFVRRALVRARCRTAAGRASVAARRAVGDAKLRDARRRHSWAAGATGHARPAFAHDPYRIFALDQRATDGARAGTSVVEARGPAARARGRCVPARPRGRHLGRRCGRSAAATTDHQESRREERFAHGETVARGPGYGSLELPPRLPNAGACPLARTSLITRAVPPRLGRTRRNADE